MPWQYAQQRLYLVAIRAPIRPIATFFGYPDSAVGPDQTGTVQFPSTLWN